MGKLYLKIKLYTGTLFPSSASPYTDTTVGDNIVAIVIAHLRGCLNNYLKYEAIK